MKNLPCPFVRRASNPANFRSVFCPFAFAVSDAANGEELELDGLLDVRAGVEVVEIRLVASRDHLDDVPTILEVGDPHDAGGIGVSGLDGVIDRDGRAPDGHGVTRPVQADHHFTGVLCSGHTGRQHRGADRRQAKKSHDSHEDQVLRTEVKCCLCFR